MTEFVERSAVGKVRRNNEDSLLCLARFGLFAVADGMGGGEEGERASRMVCEALRSVGEERDFMTLLRKIDVAILATSRQIVAYARRRGYRMMGSTVALLAVDLANPGRSAVCHIGDSRVYRLRDGAVQLLTRDHTVGAELEEQMGGDEGARLAARSNPLAHVLTNVVGGGDLVETDWGNVELRGGDRCLVCSDGVHDVIETGELAALVGEGALESAADRLEREVLKRGAPDNYTFVLVEIRR